MKLRNKKTGEIVDTLCSDDITKGISFGIDHHDGNPTMAYYCSLAELNSDWEDYEEPKDFYFIGGDGGIATGTFITEGICRYSKEIGNYFSSREEAELAVRKLKAWKRLKDKGFRFNDWKAEPTYRVAFDWNADIKVQEIQDDLDLLFSGGEE